MSKEKYNNKILNEYLLGLLPEDKAEEFDELSVTDDDFAGDLESAENDLIDAYLKKDLSESELARFQAYYLASPLRREKVEFAKSLQTVAGKHFEEINRPVEKQSWADFFASFGLSLRLAGAAFALLFVALIGWILLQNFNKQPEQVQNDPTPTPTQIQTPQNINSPTVSPTLTPTSTPTNSTVNQPTPTPKVEPTEKVTPTSPILATFILPLPRRDGGNLTTINIPAKTTDVAFTLPLESDDFKTYQITLKTQTGKIIRQSSKLNSQKGSLNIKIPAKLLQSTVYIFSVNGISETGESENVGDYSFRSVIQ